jgi:hypothetical protein
MHFYAYTIFWGQSEFVNALKIYYSLLSIFRHTVCQKRQVNRKQMFLSWKLVERTNIRISMRTHYFEVNPSSLMHWKEIRLFYPVSDILYVNKRQVNRKQMFLSWKLVECTKFAILRIHNISRSIRIR